MLLRVDLLFFRYGNKHTSHYNLKIKKNKKLSFTTDAHIIKQVFNRVSIVTEKLMAGEHLPELESKLLFSCSQFNFGLVITYL